MQRFFLGVASALLLAGIAGASDYNTISPDTVNTALASGQETIIVDICEPQMFAEGHLPGSIRTHAYPVKSVEDKAKLAQVLPRIAASDAPVVIVCPRGAGGARRTYDYYRDEGVQAARLRILEGGLEGWPYEKVTD